MVISFETAKEQAEKEGQTVEEELVLRYGADTEHFLHPSE